MPTPFETVVDLWETLINESIVLDAELSEMANHDNYRERNILNDLLAEIQAEREAQVEKLLTSHGWTVADFEYEVNLRVFAETG